MGLENSAIHMVHMYCASLPLSKELDPQESMHGEELLSMASNILVQLYWQTENSGYLLEAVMLLELGLSIRRFVSQYKILLLHLYSHLGALPVAYEWYRTLDVKNILLETVSHQILPQMLMSPLWEDLNDLLRDYLKFMDDYLRESADLTFLAYRHRNYSKVIEFVQFKERLEHSNQYLIARLELAILRLKEKAYSIEEEEHALESLKCGTQVLELASETSCKSLTFNEDFQLRPWWTPTPMKNLLLGPFDEVWRPKEHMQDYKKDWERKVQQTAQRRSLLPRMIYLSVQCVSASVKENPQVNGSVSDSEFQSEMKPMLERYAKLLGFSLCDALKVLLGVAEGKQSLEAFGYELIDWMNLAVFVNAWSSSAHEPIPPLVDGWSMVNTLLAKCVEHEVQKTGPLLCSPRGNIQVLVQLIAEPIAWHSLVLQSYVRASLPLGKRKKKIGAADAANSLLSQAVRGSALSLYGTVEIVAKWLKEENKRTEDEALDKSLSILEGGPTDGPGKIYNFLKDFISNASEAELGSRIFQAIKSWSPTHVSRKMIRGQHRMLSDFLQICNSRLKSLDGVKQQI